MKKRTNAIILAGIGVMAIVGIVAVILLRSAVTL